MPGERSDLVSSFFAYHRTRRDDLFWAWEEVTAVVHSDAEAAWALLRRLVAEARGEAELYYVAAGPLEDFLSLHGTAFIGRVVAEAEEDDNLRRALGGVWGGERMTPEVWRAVQAIAIPEGPLGAHPYEVEPPPGWIVDDSRGRSQSVYHPAGEDPASAPAVILLDAEWRDATADLRTHLERQLAERKRDDRAIVTEDAPAMRIASGAPVPAVRLRSRRGAWAIAFVEAPLVVFELVLAARSDAALDEAWPAFVRFAAGFRLGESA
jgi:hypothetical protein